MFVRLRLLGRARTPLLCALAASAVLLGVLLPAGAPPAGSAGRPAGATATASSPAAGMRPIAWQPCLGQPGYRCGTVEVPLDYGQPRGPTLQLAVTEKPAADPARRIGALLTNPGGPGESGVQILPVLLPLLPPAVRARFDVVGFDERGTGSSDPLTCGPAPAAVTSAVPVPSGPGAPYPGAQVFGQLAADCAAFRPGTLGDFNSTNAARDLDRIRAALGQQRLNYYGLSYGTVLGSVYDHLFPSHVRSMVLDGAVVATQSLVSQGAEEARAIQTALNQTLRNCAADPACAFRPRTGTRFYRLVRSLTAKPLPPPGNGDDQPVTVGDLDTATLFALSVPPVEHNYWNALVAAEGGNGAPLRAIAVQFVEDLDGVPLVGAQWTLTCEDAADHPDARAVADQALGLSTRMSEIAAFAPTYVAGGCTSWPAARQPVTSLRVRPGAPLLVIGNTDDPNTPHEWAAELSRILPRARLITWRGSGHTWLLNGASDRCMSTRVASYLLALRVERPYTCS